MTGRRVALRAGAVAALMAALLTGLPAPAQAQPGSDLELGGIGNIELRVGDGEQNVQLRVENDGDLPALGVQLTMTIPMGDLEVHIASTPPECEANDTRMDCRIDEIPPDETWTGVAQIGVHGNSPLQAGETRNGTAEVVLSGGGGSQSFNVRLKGPDRPAGVPEVTGFVTDQATGEPVEGAKVILADSQGVTLETSTDGSGNFRFASDGDNNIAPGSVGLRASKDGYEGREVFEQGEAGKPLADIQLVLRSTASPTPSARPSPSPTPTPTGTATPAAVPASGESGGGFFTTLLVILGIVFVLLGVGAIVILIIRRRRERGEEGGLAGPSGPPSGPRGPGPTPGSHGVYRPSPTAAQTQVIGGRGGPPGVGPSPALANAPTMMHQRGGAGDATMLHPRAGGADETSMLPRVGDPRAGDPPGPRPPMAGGPPPPRPAAPTYGGAATTAYPPGAGYDETRGGGRHAGGTYGTPEYGTPAHGPAYGGPARGGPADQTEVGGYGAAPPPPPGRHGRGGAGSAPPDGGSYGPDPYTRPSPYDQPGPPDQGYPDQGRHIETYGAPQAPGGQRPDPYSETTQAGGYRQPDYHRQGDYRAPDYGYDDGRYAGGGGGASGYDDAGTDEPYYDQTGQPRSRHAAEPPERRRLDWLDDT